MYTISFYLHVNLIASVSSTESEENEDKGLSELVVTWLVSDRVTVPTAQTRF